MKPLAPAALAILALLLLAAPAHAASFDCAKAGTEIEKMICGDAELSELDSQLGQVYVRSLAWSPDQEALQREQRSWLREVRDQCPSVPCLKVLYRQRLDEIAPPDRMTEEKAREICAKVVQSANDGSIRQLFVQFEPVSEEEKREWKGNYPGGIYYELDGLHSVAKVDYDSDGVEETLGTVYSSKYCGPCVIADIEAMLHRSNPRRVLIPRSNRTEETAFPRGECDRLLFVNGEPILLSGFNSSIIDVVSWLSPDGTKRALCNLNELGTARAKVVSAENPALCEAVASGEVERLPWGGVRFPRDRLARFEPEEFGKPEGGQATAIRTDIDLDGVSEIIVRVDKEPLVNNPGLCRGNPKWLVEVPDADSAPDSRPDGALGRDGRLWGPIQDKYWGSTFQGYWNAPMLFRFQGKPYILARGRRADAEVISIWDNRIESHCELDVYFQKKIKQHFQLEPEEPHE